MANKKMTYAEAITTAIHVLEQTDIDPAVTEKLTALKASIEKKNAAPKTLTAQQKKNETLKDEIVEFLADTPDTGYTVTDMLKAIPALEGDSNQHVSAVMRQLVQAQKVERYTEKRRTYFKIAGQSPQSPRKGKTHNFIRRGWGRQQSALDLRQPGQKVTIL